MVRIEEWYSYWNFYLKSRKKFKTTDIEELIDFASINKDRELKINWDKLTFFWKYQNEEYKIICLLNWKHYLVMSITLTNDFKKDEDWYYIIPVEFLDDLIDMNILQIILRHSWIEFFMKTWTSSIIRDLSLWYEKSILDNYIELIQSNKKLKIQKYQWIINKKYIEDELNKESFKKKIDKKFSFMNKESLNEFLKNSKMIWIKFHFK